jgi:hypothetical protein
MHYVSCQNFIFNLRFLGKTIFFKCLILVCTFIFFTPYGYGQSITPFIFNNLGGYTANMEWSLGEDVSIASFISANGLSLQTGGLQPLTNIVTSINEYGPAVFGDQISIGPNPAVNLLRIKAKFNEVGILSFKLLDAKSAIVFTKELGTIFFNYDTDLFLEKYPSGIFYIWICFQSNKGNSKTGVYKIIKL